LFPIGVFTWFNCGLVTTQDNSIARVTQIGEFANGIWETSKLDGIQFFLLFQVGVCT
jgi:hypothetical protein